MDCGLPGADFCQLVVGQGFGGEEIERGGIRVAEQCMKDRQIVAESLAAGCRCHHSDIVAGQGEGNGFGLMAVELLYPPAMQGVCQSRM